MTEIKYDAILVGGLDNRSGDLNLTQQTTKFKEGFGADKNVKSYRYKDSTSEVLKLLENNPYLPVFLFSAGCTKAYDISRSRYANKNLIFIIEPYAESSNTVSIINSAVQNGVPSTNVYVGSSKARGAGIVKNSSPSGSSTHWNALKEVGKKQSNVVATRSVTSASSPNQVNAEPVNPKPDNQKSTPTKSAQPVAPTDKPQVITSATIGDFISLTLQKKYPNNIAYIDKLTGTVTTTSDFINKLKKIDPIKEITKLVISIGSLDGWVGSGSTLVNIAGGAGATLVNELVLQIRRVFPNAQLYILNGSWGWQNDTPTATKPSTSAAASSKSRFTYEYLTEARGDLRDSDTVIVVYDKGAKIYDFKTQTYFANNRKEILDLMKKSAIDDLKKKYGEEIKNMVNIREEVANIPANSSLNVTSTCSDECWSKKIDAYMSFFLEKRFSVIGTKKKLSSKPTLDDSLFTTFESDMKKYEILPSTNNLISGSQSQVPQGQSVSKGEFNNSGDEKKQDSQKNQLTSNKIVNIFPTQIRPNDIVIPVPDNNGIKEEFTNGMGYLPIVWYNAYQIDIEYVQILSISYEGVLPILTLLFLDPIGIIKDKATPIDNNNITIFINSRAKNLRSVHLQFKIKTFTNVDGLMNITGTLDVDSLYVKTYKTYKDSTSNKVLQDIAKENGLGFNTNVVETNDRMNWINTGLRPYEFMEEVLEHTYISDESFVSGNLDLFYNFNFVDVQKELSRNINEELGISTTSLEELLRLPFSEEGTTLLLTNDESLSGSNNYFMSFRIYNVATKTALDKGYSDNFVYYDNNLKKAHSFDIHSMNLNEDSSITLKGGKNDKEFFDSNKSFVYGGKSDSDNSHLNYNFTKTNNERNISESEKLGTEIELPFPNFNLYRFQKLKLVFSHNVSTVTSPQINTRFTGDWLIVDIKYTFSQGSFRQVISLIKRELELSPDEIDEGLVNKQRPEGRGNFSNPAGGYATQPAPPVVPITNTPTNTPTNTAEATTSLPTDNTRPSAPVSAISDRAKSVPNSQKITSFGRVSEIVPKEGRPLLDLIAYTEGTAGRGKNGYDIMYTGRQIANWIEDYKNGHPNIKISASGITSTAAGRYQFLNDVWVSYAGNKPFNKNNQDYVGWLLIVKKRGIKESLIKDIFNVAKKQIKEGKISVLSNESFLKFLDIVDKEWASLPNRYGKSYYSKQGGKYSAADVYAIFIEAVKKY